VLTGDICAFFAGRRLSSNSIKRTEGGFHMKRIVFLILCILLLLSSCVLQDDPPISATSSQPIATEAPLYTTYNSPFLDEADEPLLALLKEADELLDENDPIAIDKKPYLDYLFFYAHMDESELRDDGNQYIIQFRGSDETRKYLRFMVFVNLLSQRYEDCFIFETIRTDNFEFRNLLFCPNYRQAGYDTAEAYLEKNKPSHTIDLKLLGVFKYLNYDYNDQPLMIDLANLPDSLPAHHTIATNAHYSVIRRNLNDYLDFYEPIPSDTDTDTPPTPITRATFAELKNAILTGDFTQEELASIQRFHKNQRGDIFIFDIALDYIPQLPDGIQVESVSWTGTDIVFNLTGGGITGYLTFHNTADSMLDQYHHFEYEGNPDYFCEKYHAGDVYFLECFQRSVSESVPIFVRFWKLDRGRSYGYLTGFTDRPKTKWLYSFGLDIIDPDKL
jgi:hypothetical protein